MWKLTKGILFTAAGVLILLLIAGPYLVDTAYDRANQVVALPPYPSDADSQALHDTLFIADLHADTFTFNDRFMEHKAHGHLDYPRAREAGFNLLTMGIATEVPFDMIRRPPEGIARDGNLILTNAIIGLEPLGNWYSNFARGNWVMDNVHRVVNEHPDKLLLITHREDVLALRNDYTNNPSRIGLLLAAEGAHILDDHTDQLDELFV
ncbi:MAG: hypothetical protein ACR2QG_09695, partial [Gammaproteobacteria bacterium]